MFFIDSHCHLIFSHFRDAFSDSCCNDFDEKYNIDAIVNRAADVNVKYLLVIGTELSDADEIQLIVDRYSNTFQTIGIHPLEAYKHCQLYSEDEIRFIMKDNCKKEKTVGVGEIGLDYHYGKEKEKQQKKIFNLQLDLAKECNLPVSIHSRDASSDVIDILNDHSSVNGVIHCFSGEKFFAKKALDLGFYISISGIVTYKKAEELHDSVKYIPLDRLLIETDSPFLPPVPFRGKLNEPAFVIYVANKISELLKISTDKIAEISSKNFCKLFKKSRISYT